jgi:hypothetical protein
MTRIARTALAAAALALATPLPAQHAGQHELGVDVGAALDKPEGRDARIVVSTPVDVRLGFPRRRALMWEPRLTLHYDSDGGAPSGARYVLTPEVNALYALGPGGHARGMYLTGGVGLAVADRGAESGASFALGAGIGWRQAYGGGALRYEVGVRYRTRNDVLGPATTSLGGRIGLSLWH